MLSMKLLSSYTKRNTLTIFGKKYSISKSLNGTNPQYVALPRLVKGGLFLAQANVESERSLSVNAHIVTQDRVNTWREDHSWP